MIGVHFIIFTGFSDIQKEEDFSKTIFIGSHSQNVAYYKSLIFIYKNWV